MKNDTDNEKLNLNILEVLNPQKINRLCYKQNVTKLITSLKSLTRVEYILILNQMKSSTFNKLIEFINMRNVNEEEKKVINEQT